MVTLRGLVLMVFLLCSSMGKVVAADAMWLDVGTTIHSRGQVGSTIGGNWMPGEWGVSLRNTDSINVGQVFECLFGLSCNDSIVMNEVALLAQHESADGTVIGGIGLSHLSYHYADPAQDDEVYGIPLELRVRSKKWNAFGVSLALRGNINEVENFVALSLLLEVGVRYH